MCSTFCPQVLVVYKYYVQSEALSTYVDLPVSTQVPSEPLLASSSFLFLRFFELVKASHAMPRQVQKTLAGNLPEKVELLIM